jgi:hypothetical protein
MRISAEQKTLFGFYSQLLEFLGLFPGAVLAPEFRFMVMGSVIITGPDQAVPASDPPAVHAGDILFHFPLRSERLRCKNKLVNPEEDQPANQVCYDCRDKLPHRCKDDSYTGKDRGTCLPAEEIEPITLVIDLHTSDQTRWIIRVVLWENIKKAL